MFRPVHVVFPFCYVSIAAAQSDHFVCVRAVFMLISMVCRTSNWLFHNFLYRDFDTLIVDIGWKCNRGFEQSLSLIMMERHEQSAHKKIVGAFRQHIIQCQHHACLVFFFLNKQRINTQLSRRHHLILWYIIECTDLWVELKQKPNKFFKKIELLWNWNKFEGKKLNRNRSSGPVHWLFIDSVLLLSVVRFRICVILFDTKDLVLWHLKILQIVRSLCSLLGISSESNKQRANFISNNLGRNWFRNQVVDAWWICLTYISQFCSVLHRLNSDNKPHCICNALELYHKESPATLNYHPNPIA